MRIERLDVENAFGGYLARRRRKSPIELVTADLDLSPATLGSLSATLSGDEWERASRLGSTRDRRRWLAARGWLRHLLADRLGCNAIDIAFARGPYGKPRIAAPRPADRLTFSVSHSDGLALFAFATDRPVGVDIEAVNRELPWEGLATRFFAEPEGRHVLELRPEQRSRGFLALWTMKEAYAKACACSVVPALKGPAMIPTTRARAAKRVRLGRWTVTSLRPAAGYVGAFAIES